MNFLSKLSILTWNYGKESKRNKSFPFNIAMISCSSEKSIWMDIFLKYDKSVLSGMWVYV